VTTALTPSPANSRKSFGSDNHAGAHPEILDALRDAGQGDAAAYGDDPWTARAVAQLCEAFGLSEPGGVCFVFNGTAANVLGISLMLRPYEAVICSEEAHLNVDECGAAERIVGCKLLTVPAPDGKLTPELVASRLPGRGDEHRAQPRAVAITQATEVGTCYTIDELRRLGEFCRANDLLVYMDGARLANAAAFLGCSLADLAAHVDVLSFGGTKNGAMGAEALIVANPALAAAVPFQRKQQLQLASKMRYLAAQFSALLADGLWLRNARQANAMAQRLADGVSDVPGVRLRYPVESNGVFVTLDPGLIEPLQREWSFHVWDAGEHTARWMAAYDTTEADIDAFLASIRTATGATSPAPVS
jgi:threonine aldolase